MIDIAGLPHSDKPHRYGAMTCGDIAAQLLAIHPRAAEATEGDVRDLVAALAEQGPNLVEYRIGGQVGGQLGQPGTWVGVATGPGMQRIMHLSPFHNDLIDPDRPPDDPTVMDRVRHELERLSDVFAANSGERIPIPRLLRHQKDITTNRYDLIFHEAPGGDDHFHGSFSHVALPATHSMAVTNCLDQAFDQIRTQHRHWTRIEAAIAENASRARRRFEAMGAVVGGTHLVSIDKTLNESLGNVLTTTELDVLGDNLRPRTVMLNLRNPPRVDKGEIDGWRVHARDHRRRQRILAGRDPADAITVCPILARSIPRMTPAHQTLLQDALRCIALGRKGPSEAQTDDAVRGLTIRDGHIIGTVAMAGGTWRGRTLQVPGVTLPDTVLTALAGRPMTAVTEDPRLEGATVARAWCDAKGRLNVAMETMPGVPVRDAIDACE